MFPIAVALFEAQQLNKKQNGPWKQMRSDDCTTAWTDWLNDFFFISAGSSTFCTASLPLVLAAPFFLSLLPSHYLANSQPLFSLWDPMHHFFCLNHSTSFTTLLFGSYSALLCVSNSDCLQISRILISTDNHGATISVMSIVKIDFVCLQNSFKVLSHI